MRLDGNLLKALIIGGLVKACLKLFKKSSLLETINVTLNWPRPGFQNISTEKVLFCQTAEMKLRFFPYPPFSATDQPFKISI